MANSSDATTNIQKPDQTDGKLVLSGNNEVPLDENHQKELSDDEKCVETETFSEERTWLTRLVMSFFRTISSLFKYIIGNRNECEDQNKQDLPGKNNESDNSDSIKGKDDDHSESNSSCSSIPNCITNESDKLESTNVEDDDHSESDSPCSSIPNCITNESDKLESINEEDDYHCKSDSPCSSTPNCITKESNCETGEILSDTHMRNDVDDSLLLQDSGKNDRYLRTFDSKDEQKKEFALTESKAGDKTDDNTECINPNPEDTNNKLLIFVTFETDAVNNERIAHSQSSSDQELSVIGLQTSHVDSSHMINGIAKETHVDNSQTNKTNHSESSFNVTVLYVDTENPYDISHEFLKAQESASVVASSTDEDITPTNKLDLPHEHFGNETKDISQTKHNIPMQKTNKNSDSGAKNITNTTDMPFTTTYTETKGESKSENPSLMVNNAIPKGKENNGGISDASYEGSDNVIKLTINGVCQ